MDCFESAAGLTSPRRDRRRRLTSVTIGYLFVTIAPTLFALACADAVDMSGQTIGDDTSSLAPATPSGAALKQAQRIAVDPSAGWPADCEEVYVLRAHGDETPGDATPYRVRGGSDEGIRFYFDLPWQGDRQLLTARMVFDNRAIVHHWDLYTIENLQGADAAIFSARSFLDQIRLKDMKAVVGGGSNPQDAALPDGVGFQLPTGPNVGLLFELHYFAAEEGGFEEDASALEICVTSKPRPHTAESHALGREHFELPAHTNTNVEADCVPPEMSEPVHLVGFAPHMHAAGTHARLVLHRASGEEIVLHDQPYDFREQRVYWLKSPDGQPDVLLEQGDTLSVTCSYDNTLDTTILSGSTKDNEMCSMPVWAWPAGILNNGLPNAATSCTED